MNKTNTDLLYTGEPLQLKEAQETDTQAGCGKQPISYDL